MGALTDPIVTVTPTIMDGIVVRWYTSLHAAEHVEPVLSASRERVMFHGGVPDVPAAWVEAAHRAHEALAAQRYQYYARTPDSVTALATHETSLFGPVKPIEVAP